MDRRRRVSMREVAELADVAISSVSRVLSEHPDVSDEMRARVLEAVAKLEYEPDFLAQSLRRGETRSVGFVAADISNPLFASVASGVESVLRSNGYSLMFMGSEGQPSLDVAHIRFLLSRRVDGLILSLASETDPATLDQLAKLEVPIVLLDRDMPPELGASAVQSDHATGMRQAVDHLLDLGHRRIALVTGSLDLRPGHARLKAMHEAIAARGLPDESIHLPGSFSVEHGLTSTNELLDLDEPPTAIIAGGNHPFVGVLTAITERGLRPGDDISLIACDDIPLARIYTPPIASISRDARSIGQTASRLLLERLIGGGGPETAMIPTTYVARASVAPPAGGRPPPPAAIRATISARSS
jgi:LacI family transcriptional regulator